MTKRKERDFSICEIFKEWFAENKHRFIQKCRIRHYKSREYKHVDLYFENVAPEIMCWVSEGLTLEIAAYYERTIVDFIYDLECTVVRGRNRKYYCSFCDPPNYYKTPKELVVAHTFENFLKWANEKFTTDHVLRLEHGTYWYSGRIITKKELLENPVKEPTGNKATLIIPVIKSDGVPVLHGTPLTKVQQAAYSRRKNEKRECPEEAQVKQITDQEIKKAT